MPHSLPLVYERTNNSLHVAILLVNVQRTRDDINASILKHVHKGG